MSALGDKIHVSEVFTSVQGEGHHVGTLCKFVRLWGCNAADEKLACVSWCDTRYAWASMSSLLDQYGVVEWDAPDFFSHIEIGYLPVVFTGGEPLLQLQHHWSYVKRLAEIKPVHIETNGTIDIPEKALLWITCSPKPPRYEIRLSRMDELKIVVPRGFAGDFDRLYALIRLFDTRYSDIPKYLQPQDNDLDIARFIINALPSFPTWRLGLQLHKILSVR